MTKKTKVQIMLPEELVRKINTECEETFMKKSSWFEKLVHSYFSQKAAKLQKGKKIELDI